MKLMKTKYVGDASLFPVIESFDLHHHFVHLHNNNHLRLHISKVLNVEPSNFQSYNGYNVHDKNPPTLSHKVDTMFATRTPNDSRSFNRKN